MDKFALETENPSKKRFPSVTCLWEDGILTRKSPLTRSKCEFMKVSLDAFSITCTRTGKVPEQDKYVSHIIRLFYGLSICCKQHFAR